MSDSAKTRTYERRQLAAEIYLQGKQGEGELIFDSADISPAGVFLKSDLLLDVGEAFDVVFTLPGESAAMRVSGEVVRVDRGSPASSGDADAGSPPGMGIKFVDLSDDDEARILAYTRQD